MLEYCTNLNECEHIIIQKLGGINFLGQIELNRQDVAKLGKLIKNKLNHDSILGLEQIGKHTPACLSLYLVGKGIFDYNDGDFWSSIFDDIGYLDTNIQAKMGNVFLDFIKNNNLSEFYAGDTFRYVTPILLHGGIPQNCLPEYFDKIVHSCVHRGIIEEEKIKDYLYTLRIHEKKKILIKKEIEELRDKVSNLNYVRKAYKQKGKRYHNYNKCFELNNVPDNEYQIDEIKMQKENLAEEIEKSIQKLNELRNELDGILKNILSSDWDNEIISRIINVDLDDLAEKIGKLNDIAQKFNREKNADFSNTELIVAAIIMLLLIIFPTPYKLALIVGYLLFASFLFAYLKKKSNRAYEKIRKEHESIYTGLVELLSGIPLKHGIIFDDNIKLIDTFKKIKDIYSEYNVEIEKLSKVNNNVASQQNTMKETAAVIDVDACETGPVRIEKEIDSEREGRYCIELSNHIDSIDRKIQELKSLIQEKENELAGCSQTIGIVDEPIQRFIMSGGKWAEELIVESIKLMAKSMNGSQVNGNYSLPERVVSGFEVWWPSRCQSYLPVEPNRKNNEQKLNKPYISYDSAAGGVKIVIGPQQLDIADKANCNICINIVYSDPPYANQTFLLQGHVNENGMVQTIPCELYLGQLFGKISVHLIINDKTYSWDYDLITKNTPYIAFTEDGKHIKAEDLPGKTIWIILWDKYMISEDINIIEESIAGGSAKNTTAYLIDLFGYNSLKLKAHDGSELSKTVSNSRFFEPYVDGGEIVDGISFNGEKVYCKMPEYIVIPFDENNLRNWSLTTRYSDGLSQRQHYFVSDLNSVNIFSAEGKARISLSENGILKNDWQGRMSMTLYYRNKKQFVFDMNLVRDLRIINKPYGFEMPLNVGESIVFNIAVPDRSSIELLQPAKAEIKCKNIYEIITEPVHDTVKGKIIMAISDGIYFETQLLIEIPVLKWKIKELSGFDSWNCFNKEIWLEDLNRSDKLILELYIPCNECRFLKLYTSQYTRVQILEIKNRIASFDIRKFFDSFKAGDKLQKLCADFYNKEGKRIQTGAIFHVQCRWEVFNFKYAVDDYNGKRKITLYWEEKGKCKDRAITIWKSWEPYAGPACLNVPDNTFSIDAEFSREQMPDGDYLIHFSTIDPWDGSKQDNLMPMDSFNTFILSLSDGTPYIDKWKVSWNGKNDAIIQGNIANAESTYEIAITIYGIQRGKEISCTSVGITDPDGNFNLCISNNNTEFILKNIAHWIGFYIAGEKPIYEFSLMPDPGFLEWSVTDPTDLKLENELRMFNIRMDTVEGHLNTYTLSETTSKKIFRSLVDNENFELDIRVSGSHYAKLKYDADINELYLEMGKGVKCSCGKILPNQHEWYTHSAITHCKSLFINYSRVEVIFFLIWDSKALFGKKDNCMLLYSSRCNPIAEDDTVMDFAKTNRVINLLWEKEKDISIRISGGEN